MATIKKETRGRKKLPKKDRRRTVTVGLKETDIARHGGESKLKQKLTKFVEQ